MPYENLVGGRDGNLPFELGQRHHHFSWPSAESPNAGQVPTAVPCNSSGGKRRTLIMAGKIDPSPSCGVLRRSLEWSECICSYAQGELESGANRPLSFWGPSSTRRRQPIGIRVHQLSIGRVEIALREVAPPGAAVWTPEADASALGPRPVHGQSRNNYLPGTASSGVLQWQPVSLTTLPS